MTRILATAGAETRIAIRNRWVTIAILTMAVFSLVLAAAGSAPTGALGADALSVTIASLTSLAVYLVPLMALLMSFDAIAGEVEHGTLSLVLTYPIRRAEILVGKFIAHLATMTLALAVGYGLAAGVTIAMDAGAVAGLPALFRLLWTSVLLGAAFLCLGYALSAWAGRPGAAAGMAIGLWLVMVVLYDLGLLAAIVADGGGWFTTDAFPWLLIGNPADAFRLFNLGSSEATSAAAGLSGAANSIPLGYALTSLLSWPVIAFGLAVLSFRKVSP